MIVQIVLIGYYQQIYFILNYFQKYLLFFRILQLFFPFVLLTNLISLFKSNQQNYLKQFIHQQTLVFPTK